MNPVVAFALVVVAFEGRASAHQPPGCYRFSRPLGQSASGQLEAADSSWYRLQLLPGGAVARPALSSAYWRQQYEERSSWREQGDSLIVRVTTGLVGWELTLTAAGDGYSGAARYLTDVRGGQPYFARVQAKREPCSASPPD
jgi:hypothetical protein